MGITKRQQDIVKAAFILIADQGMQELTIKNIARVVGVSEPALYRHFDSKASILSAIVDEIIAMRNEAWRDASLNNKSADKSLVSFFMRQAQSFESFPPLAIILFPDMLFQQDPDLLKRVHGMIQETSDQIRKILETGVREGSLKKDLDIDIVSMLLIGGFRMVVSAWRMKNAGPTVNISLVERTQLYIDSSLRLITNTTN